MGVEDLNESEPFDDVSKGYFVDGNYWLPALIGKTVMDKRFKEQIRARTTGKAGISTIQLIQDINPVIRGWGNYYCKAHVRKLFNQLRAWILRRIWSHRFKRWRNTGWKRLPEDKLYHDYGLVNLIYLIPSIKPKENILMKARSVKTARRV